MDSRFSDAVSVRARGLGSTQADSHDIGPEAKQIMTLAVTLKRLPTNKTKPQIG